MRRLVVAVRAAVVRAAFAVACRLPLRARVVLATSHAASLTGNLAWIRDALESADPPVPVVVLASRPEPGVRGRIAALAQSVRAGYHLATARLFVVDDYYFPMYVIRPRPGTTRVQVWHACGAFKKFGYSVLDKAFGADDALVARVRIHGNYDLCLVSSMGVAPFYAEAFRQPLDRFTSELGIPRTDLFFDADRMATAGAAIRGAHPALEGRRTILYAPTFRGERITRARDPGLLDLARLRSVLGDDHVVLLRLHPFIRRGRTIPPELADFVVDVSAHPDINELMLVSDLLVTDYSSAIYEFALLGRPILFLAPDHADYERERGFYLEDLGQLPGPIFETTDALAAHIRAGRFDHERVRAFAAAAFDVADGRATERFVERVVRPVLAGRPPAVRAGVGSDR